MPSSFPPWSSAVIHVDMNACFASIEQQDRPELRGRPVGITNGLQGTCIVTSSCEARAYGDGGTSPTRRVERRGLIRPLLAVRAICNFPVPY